MSSNERKTLRWWLLAVMVILTANFHLYGQVKFKVALLSDNTTYRVSMLPEETWMPPLNITSTAQVTLKVPTGGFDLDGITSLTPSTFWSNNARFNQPVEAPAYDYISFGLTSLGTSGFNYTAGVEVNLFEFQNTGLCTGPVEIMEANDAFCPPNSINANVNNQITTFGTGSGSNGFSGSYDLGSANCLPDAGCQVAFELDALPDGRFQVSLIPDVTWSSPDNVTDTLRVCLSAYAESFELESLQSLVPSTAFSLANTFLAPAQNPMRDYFIIHLTNSGATAIPYTSGVKTPLFTFSNGGSCLGDSLRIVDAGVDPFAQANIMARNRIMTAGSVIAKDACVLGNAQSLQAGIVSINTSSPTDCSNSNGTINILANGADELEYSINSGINWQSSSMFDGLAGGTYNVKVRKGDGTCEVAFTDNPVELATLVSPVIDNIVEIQPVGCGNNNGSIFIQASSGINREYSINGGGSWDSNNIFTNLGPGSYQTAVRNSDGSCEILGDLITLNSAGMLPNILSVNTTEPTDCEGGDGTISISASGQNLEYSINNGLTWFADGEFDWLGEGNYNILVKNPADGCVAVYADNPVSLFKQGCPGCIVEYKLELLPDGKYQISVIPHETWAFPQSITSTAQVTIVVPTGGFFVSNLTNLLPGVTFNDNVRIDQPTENPGFDYIAFGLETLGTSSIPYEDGIEVPLFTFENGGVCTGPGVYLMDDNTDPFVPPNSQNSNVGQQLTTVGSGQDAFVCILDPGFAPCAPDLANDLEAIDDEFDFFANTTFSSQVLGNDLNPGLGFLTVSSIPISAPAHGTLTLNINGTFTFVPTPGYVGVDQFEYLVCDDGTPAACDTGLVILHINPALLAVDDFYSISAGNLLINNLLANDLNLAGNQWLVNLSPLVPPSNGTVSLSANGEFTYTPNPGFDGDDSFQYVVCQSTALPLCDTATVFVTVRPAVEAEDDFFTAPQNGSVTDEVTNNDFYPPGLDIEVSHLPGSGPYNGTLTLNLDGTFIYTPNPGFSGTDQFSYALCEVSAATNCDAATVQITVQSGLVAVDDVFDGEPGDIIAGNVLGNDAIPNGTMVTVSVPTGGEPSNGSLILNPDGTFSYLPNPGFAGEDEFTYVVCENAGAMVCDTATVTLNISSELNAVDDYFNVAQGGTCGGDVLQNDLTGGDDVIVSLLPGGPANGVATLQPDGQFDYIPDPGFSGTDFFDYQICLEDQPTVCDTARVYVTVYGAGQAPPTPITNCQGEVCTSGNIALHLLQNYTGSTVSYNWFNGAGAVVGFDESLNLPADSPLAVPPFRVRVIVDGNLTGLSSTCNIEMVSPPVALATVDGPVCAGDDVQLFADSQPGYHYEWRINGQPELLSTQANPFIFNILQPADYTVTVFNDACPNQATATVSVQVNPAPVITDIVGGGTYCHGEEVTLSAVNGAAGVGDLTYTWTGPDNFYYTSPASAGDDFAVTLSTLVADNEGAYTLTLSTDEGCSPPAQSVIVDYVPIPETPELSVTDNQLCEGEALELNSSLHTGNTVTYGWYLDDGSGPGLLGSSTYPTFFLPSVNVASSGNYYVSVNVDGCDSEPSNLQDVTVVQTNFEATNPTTVTSPACEGADVILSTPIIPGAIYQWYGPNGFEADIPNPVVDAAELNDSGEYVAVVNIPNCNAEVVSSTEVFIAPMPNEPFLTNNGPICEGGDLVLSVNNPDVSGNVTYRFYYEPTNTVVGANNTGTLLIPGAAMSDAGLYFSMAEQGGCIADPANMSGVSVDSQPANAAVGGGDETLCGLVSEVSLEAIPPSFGTGFWTSPTGAVLVNPDQASTLANGLEEGDNIFIWALSNGSCENYSIDSITITVADVPNEVAVVGQDLTTCGENTLTLTASLPSTATGSWSQPAWQDVAGVTIADPANPQSEISGLQAGEEYVFVWNLSFGACQNYSADALNVTVNEAPNETAYIIDNELFICDEATAKLEANPTALSTGNWYSLNGATITTPSSPTTLATDLQSGANQFVWALSSGDCPVFSTDTMTVYNEELEVLPDSYTVSVGDSVSSFSPTENDFLQNVEGWELTIVSAPQMGELIQNTDGTFTYRPYESAFGEDEMIYMICSENCPNICDMGRVRFVIDATPTSPEDCFIPNTITPNGDGYNDQFVVPCAAAYPGSKCTIFNRWGDPIFEAEDYQNDWDGTYNGNPLPVGTYYYVIIFNDGNESVRNGYVVVYRE